MEEDCPLSKAIRSGNHDDIMWRLFRNMAAGRIVERNSSGGSRYHTRIGKEKKSSVHIWLMFEWMSQF